MIKIKNKFISAFLIGALSITTVTGIIVTSSIKEVHATTYPSESKALRDAKAKISHLTKSLKTNYLGIKNQGTWELYIKQAKDLISKIPNSERAQKDALTVEVNKDEALVKGLGRINHVEKSIQTKSDGGYGNYLGIKNAETWREYLRLASIDLDKVDKSIFRNQYDELINRMNNVDKTVQKIEDDFQLEYDKVVKLYNKAKDDNDLDKAKVALVEAEKLGTCDRSDNLEKDIKELISNLGNSSENINEIVTFPDKELERVIRIEINKPKGDIYKSDVEKITALSAYNTPGTIKDISGLENLTNLEYLHFGYSELSETDISDITPLKNLINLEYLYLGGNNISSLDPLKNLINLEFLNLNSNNITDISPLSSLPKLKDLYLDHNEITDIHSLKKIITLESLDLSANNISDISALRSLKNIEFLDLCSNKITNISILPKLFHLDTLFISSNPIANYEPLYDLFNLTNLGIGENQMSEDDIDKFLQIFPDCFITYIIYG